MTLLYANRIHEQTRRTSRWIIGGLIVLSSVLPATASAQNYTAAFEGLTRPSRDVELVLRVSGVLAKLPVSPGTRVAAGDLVAELKSDLERQSLEIARLKSESDHQIRLAKTARKLKQTELNQLEELASKQAASQWEVETTRVEVELEQVRIEAAVFEKQLAAADYAREKLLLNERRLLAPFDGSIQRTLKDVGEGVADLEPIVVLVALDPIRVECNLPADMFGLVNVRTAAVVESSTVTRGGNVVAADPSVDAASDTFRVIIEVPNKDGAITAGVAAKVRFDLADSN